MTNLNAIQLESLRDIIKDVAKACYIAGLSSLMLYQVDFPYRLLGFCFYMVTGCLLVGYLLSLQLEDFYD